MKTAKSLLCATMLCLASPLAAEQLSGSIWFPETHPIVAEGYVALADRMKEETGGALTMQVYTGTSLLPPVAHLSGLTDGIVDMTYHAGTYTPSDLPEDNTIAALAISLPDSMAAALAVGEFYLTDPDMQAMFKRLGIVFLGSYASPQYVMMCSSRIETLDDIRGKKLRMPSPMHAAWAESVGAVPVNVPSSEMFSGLEKGQLDCAINAANDLKARSLWDVAKYTTLLELGPYYAGWLQAIAAPRWQSLSAEHRAVLLGLIPDAVVESTIAQSVAVDKALAEAPDHGVEVIQPTADLKKSVDDFVADNMRTLTVETGEKLQAKDPAALVERFQQVYRKWDARLAELPADDPDAIKAAFRSEVYEKLDSTKYGL